MRVSFSLPLKPLSGKQIFACRLARSLEKLGVEIVTKRPDINIVIVKGTKNGCKNILRLDGIWMNSDVDCKHKNKKLQNHLLECDGVIYQNEFCKKSSDKMICKTPKPHAIIGNGINPDIFKNRKKFEHKRPYIMALCKWRPHKRLKVIVKGFLQSGLQKEFDLRILGEPDYRVKDPSVIYMGDIPNASLLDVLVSSEYTVHLAYVDWCPNSVIESVMAGKNVLHTDSGGTKIIVKDNSICIPETKPWDFRIVKLYKPPSLDMDKLASGYRDMMDLPTAGERMDLHIDTVANQYLEFFRRIL